MSTNDELLFGNEKPRSRDSDGDGVTDAQEGLDGTDANDAGDSIRHDTPSVNPVSSGPLSDLIAPNLEAHVTIDVAANTPTGMSLDQALPVGLDGAIPTQHRYGNADAENMMGTHVDQNSPLNMQRSPSGTGAGTPGVAPPSGAELGYRAPNASLVGSDLPEYEEPPEPDGGGIIEWVKDLFTAEPKYSSQPLKEFDPPKEPAPPHVPLPPQRGPKMAIVGTVDPDAEGGGAVSEGDLARAVLLAGADTDFVRGAAPKVEADSPLTRPGDLVTDRNPDGDGSEIDISTVAVRPPGAFFTDGINPDAGFGTGLAPSPGGGGGGGGTGGGGDVSRQSASYSATAADADTSPESDPSRGIFTVESESSRHRDSDSDGTSDAQERFERTDPNNADDFIRHDVPTAGPSNGDPRGDVDGPTPRPDAPIDVRVGTPTGLSVDQGLPVGLDGAAIPTRHTYGNADADQLLAGRVDENSPLDMSRSPFGSTDIQGDGDRLHTAPPGVELNFNAPNNSLVGNTDGGTPQTPKETPEARYKRESGFPEHDTAEDKVKNRESNKAQKDAEDWAKRTAPKTQSDPDATGGNSTAPTAEELARAVAIAGADTDFVRGHGGAPQIEGDPPPKPGSLVTDPGPDGDGSAFDTSTVVPIPPGGFFTDGINPDAGFGSGLAPSPGTGTGGTGGGDGGDRQGTDYAATAADSTTVVADSDTISVVQAAAGGDGIHSVSDITGVSTGSPGRELPDSGGGRSPVESSGELAAPIGIIIPDFGRSLEVGEALVAPAPLDALEPLDPVAAAMSSTSEPAVESPTESFEGLAADDSMAAPDDVNLDDGF